MIELFVAIGFVFATTGFILSMWSYLIIYGLIRKPVNEVVAAYVWHVGALGGAVAIFGLFILNENGVNIDFFDFTVFGK